MPFEVPTKNFYIQKRGREACSVKRQAEALVLLGEWLILPFLSGVRTQICSDPCLP